MNRRKFALLTSVVPLGAVCAASVPGCAASAQLASPDAELIRLCAEHVVNRATYNRDGGYLELEDDPLWAAYERTRDAIGDAKPVTLEGMLAKARAAKDEARTLRGGENPENCPAADWAWDLLNDLLRLNGQLQISPSVALPVANAADATLIAACAKLERAYHHYDAVYDEIPTTCAQEERARQPEVDRRMAAFTDLEAQVLAMEACTLEGVRSMARAALAGATRYSDTNEIEVSDDNEAVAWSALEALVRL